MFDVVLYQPEIPPNTGNVIRLCANSGCRLHLVEPLGYRLDDRQLKRAGLDYHEYATLRVHPDWDALRQALEGRRFFGFSTRGTVNYDRVAYRSGDVLVFGTELLESFAPENRLRLPMMPDNRSLNLSNAVAVAVYEGWRQNQFRLGG
jgi:tRNA (cytidine/uridine-2'-O-)-methyltransferase